MNTFDRAIASAVDEGAVPAFPDAAIRSAFAARRARSFGYSFKQKIAAAAALFACCAGLAYAAPKVMSAIHLSIGSGKLEIITPDSVAVTDTDIASESAFHARIPSGWPANMTRGGAWRTGPAHRHEYILQYSGTGANTGAGAVVFLQKAGAGPGTLQFRKKNGAPIGVQWNSGDEHITVLSQHLSAQQLGQIRASLP